MHQGKSESFKSMTRSASLEDIELLAESPTLFHLSMSLKTDGADQERREYALGRVSTETGDRHLVVGAVPNCAGAFIVPEREIAHLSVVYD